MIGARRSARPGFSLLELMVAIVIIATLVGTMTGFVFDVLRTRDALEDLTARERAAGVLFDTLERDLQTVIATGPDGGRGISGDASGLRLAVATTPVRLAVPGRGAQALGTVDWLEARFDAATRSVRLRRIPAAGEDPPSTASRARSSASEVDPDAEDARDDDEFVDEASEPAFDETDAARPVDPDAIGGEFHLVEFRYHDGDGWQDRFDGGTRGLPVAVEISIWFDPWPGAEPEEEGLDELDESASSFALGAGDEVFDPSRFASDDTGFADAESERPLPDRRRIIAVPDARAGEVADAFAAADAADAATDGEGAP